MPTATDIFQICAETLILSAIFTVLLVKAPEILLKYYAEPFIMWLVLMIAYVLLPS